MQEPYIHPVSPPPVVHTDNSRFGTWDRRTLEKLAEAAIEEIEALKGELATALAGWRRAVVDTAKNK